MCLSDRSYFTDVKNKTKAEFIKLYPYPFLVQYGDDSKNNNQTIFSTVIVTRLESIINEKDKIKNVIPVIKSNRNSFFSKITIGRTPSQDIIIDDISISKFQGYFESRDGINYTICDRGSTNGSRLNGIPLPPSVPKPVNDKDIISFAQVSYTFYSPESAYDVIKVMNLIQRGQVAR
jgi:pSer/pThr/pTyr-binding forkhead associated (FHA) protein